MTKQQRKILIKIIIGAVLFAVGMVVTHLLTLPWWAELLIFLAVYLVPGFSVLEKAVRNIAHGQVFDENFLMTIASIAAFAIGQYPEAVEVILFYQVGELFEKIAVGRSRQAVSDLLDLCPDEATVLRDGKPETVLVDEVEVGEHILVRPGEKIPLDAAVFEGHTTIDTAALTGESMPVSAAEGDAVCSGCVNLSGAVELVVTKPASESTASKIMELVEESASSKAKTVTVLGDARRGKAEFRQFDLPAYLRKHFNMFGGPEYRVTLRCTADLESAMRDRFGKAPVFVPEEDGTHFHFDVPVCVSPQFYGWVCGFDGKVEVTAPAEVRKGIHDMVQALAKQHD